MKIKYFNRETKQIHSLEIPTDCINITIPPQEGQPELDVVVNTEAVQVCEGCKRISLHEFTDLLAERE